MLVAFRSGFSIACLVLWFAVYLLEFGSVSAKIYWLDDWGMKTTSYHYITYPSWRSCFFYLAVDMRRMIWSLTGCSKVLRRAIEIHSYGQYCIRNITARSTDVSFSHSIFSRCFTTSQKVLHLWLYKKKLRKNVWISFVFTNRLISSHTKLNIKKKKSISP